jgi:hypothetical protein
LYSPSVSKLGGDDLDAAKIPRALLSEGCHERLTPSCQEKLEVPETKILPPSSRSSPTGASSASVLESAVVNA